MVLNIVRESLWKQFGASIDMLKNAIMAWPEERWDGDRRFFYMAYHTLFFLDYYLTNPPDNFEPLLSCRFVSESEMPEGAIDDILPVRIYSRKEILEYLEACRIKCRKVIAGFTGENLDGRWVETPGNRTFVMLELLLYNMRHVQHHAAQLNMMLRREIQHAPRWVSRAVDDLEKQDCFS